jgi:hypothetical protein
VVDKIDINPSMPMRNPYNPEPSRIVPIPEGRMRSQEASRYSNSLDANISRDSIATNRRPNQSSLNKSSLMGKTLDAAQAAANVSKRNEPPGATSKAVARNPFDDNDSEVVPSVRYDETKNPFADESEEELSKKDDRNPFGEYDNNLNPFS